MRGFKEIILRLLLPLLFQLLILSVTAQEPTIAKQGCQSMCGNVIVPFPFGIGEEHCYLDEDYVIDCHQNDRPFLRRINVEVLNISLDESTMRVNHPVFKVCQNGKTTINETVNLGGTTFFFSKERNMLTGFGCSNFVYMSYEDSIYRESTTYLGGCLSFCDSKMNYSNTKNDHNSCANIRCCQTTMPFGSQHFNITMDYKDSSNIGGGEAGEQQECRYAFLADLKSFHQEKVLHMKTHVPVTLDWRVNTTFPLLSTISTTYESYEQDFGYLRGGHAVCRISYRDNDGYDVGNYKNTVYCYCGNGYEGNPYLEDGCTDIDECKRNQQICPAGYVCKNTPGDYNCYDYDPKPKIRAIVLGVGISLAVLFLIVMAWRLSIIIKRRKVSKRKKEFFKRNGGLLLQQHLTAFSDRVDRCTLFTSDDLDKVTDNFNKNRILGQGGQGTVYKGMMADGRIIAVKKSTIVDEWKLEEFINEVVILSQINHRNVVKLLDCCLETDVPLLVYEFVPNGTLFQYLHNQIEEVQFTWDMRLRIATEVAEALSYLHSAASVPIYHRDIKSANILLDEMLRAKVADFGTSKSFAIDQTHVTTKVMGTFGYLDPEYHQSGQFTDKSDVYSYGVVLVELLTGKTPMKIDKDGTSISKFIASMEENCLYEILDTEVRSGKKEEIMTIASLAQSCLNLDGKKRPTMKEVAIVLEKTRASQKRSEVEQNYDENICDKTKVIKLSDITYPSTSSTSATVGPSADDEEPLMMG